MDKRKVMIVDDEIDFLKLAKINLETAGRYEVSTVSDATDVISLAKLFEPDVILLDIMMPKADGVEVCKMLNTDPGLRDIPIIALSALDTDKDKLMMFKVGVIDYLIKPIEAKDLIAKIEKALETR